MEMCGHNRTPWRVPSNGNVRNCGHFSTYRRMPCFAVPVTDVTIEFPGSRPTADQSGERDGQTVPRYIIAIRETARRPPGFVEGNRVLPQPRRDHGPALGEAGGDTRSPPSARPDGLGLRRQFRTRCVGANPQTAFGAGRELVKVATTAEIYTFPRPKTVSV